MPYLRARTHLRVYLWCTEYAASGTARNVRDYGINHLALIWPLPVRSAGMPVASPRLQPNLRTVRSGIDHLDCAVALFRQIAESSDHEGLRNSASRFIVFLTTRVAKGDEATWVAHSVV